MKRTISIMMLSSLIFLAACGGREPDPVMVVRNEDTNRNCAYLVNEIEVIEHKVHKLLPETDKRFENVAYGVAGFYTFFIPWLLMDFKNADAIEYKALRARHAHLSAIATDKGCEFTPLPLPSLEEVKSEYKMQKEYEKLREKGEETAVGTVEEKTPVNE